MSDDVELLKRVYDLFNSRDIESVLAAMHPDVIWANGMEGGHVHGRDEVRSYWKRQWAILNPHVEPVEISSNGEGEVVIKVHQVPVFFAWPLLHSCRTNRLRKSPTCLVALMRFSPLAATCCFFANPSSTT